MTTLLAEGFFLGIATGTTCLATCGPVYAPYLMQYDRNVPRGLLAILELSAGRFIAYLATGAVAGALGTSFAVERNSLITAAGYCLFSVFLLVTALRTYRRDRSCGAGRWAGTIDRPLVLGVLTGINICPPFLLALTKAFHGSGLIAGGILFSAFFAGTSLFLLPLAAFGVLGSRKTYRSVARWVGVAVSLWFLTQAGALIYQVGFGD